jgi:hypothetical protein
MKVLKLNEKGNKSKKKTVKEKKKSRMENALNIFDKSGREREDRVEVEEEKRKKRLNSNT